MTAIDVGITTTGDAARRAMEATVRVGGCPVHLPCIEVHPASGLDAIRRRASDADVVLLTSVRVVDALWPTDAPPIPAVAVGASTARAVRARGGQVLAEGYAGLEALLVDPDVRALLRERRVLYPRSDRARDVAAVEAVAGELDAPVAYRVVSVPPPDDPVDVVVFGSPSAVTGWTAARGLDLPTVAIGPTTAAAVRSAGGRPAVADRPTWEDAVRLAVAQADSTTRSP